MFLTACDDLMVLFCSAIQAKHGGTEPTCRWETSKEKSFGGRIHLLLFFESVAKHCPGLMLNQDSYYGDEEERDSFKEPTSVPGLLSLMNSLTVSHGGRCPLRMVGKKAEVPSVSGPRAKCHGELTNGESLQFRRVQSSVMEHLL